ncbi:membrane fusion protein (multidrug efflux system) [Bradyrhizobium japonicum]|uniref:Membrane fusion protein (Multidrug efflux system) n=1 Tax=Bradyrhizobium japonicum TaxID=375 RepID=A0ABV2RID4_BRAJP|nr:HlyD family secretion protein [Bradyrhizobium japonicum]MCS3498230.1 membrane fusion protein (multidrug efflux system) [Bradyrhizobium japonicum]MCS3959609.1 membrane fusion protein (multidrug efflux system) [Bradyrhizobium japonicum]MCS4001363.1 membrane fusion protein (multidrug efflux system) [Bradyrhizobium japonicum]UQD99563.1 HlyD family secretion protein [Bradyrhizobium japonicum]WLB19569.1 HlyD family secretion protein [Bradyrhizobium japonicum]
MSQQEQIAPPPAAAPPAPIAPPKPTQPPASSLWSRLAIPLFAVIVALAFVALATLRFDEWVGNAVVQTTNDAYVRADLTRLASRVSGEVLTVGVTDFQRVKAGDLLIQIDPADYEAQVAQSEAAVAAAQAVLDNLSNQIELQYATIAQAQAAQLSAEALEVEARQEQDRQKSLTQTEAGTRQRLEQAVAGYAKAQADVRASRAVIAAQQHQLEVLQGTKKQRAADVAAAKATLASAKLKLGYTRITAPFDGVVGERQVQPGDYVNIGTNLINVVPLPKVYVIANYKETQLTHVAPGQPVEITVDSFPREKLRGKVERIAPATGAQVALLPPDNATGNFTKVVQRIPVRIQFDDNQPLLARLVPGMSVVTSIDTKVANGGK